MSKRRSLQMRLSKRVNPYPHFVDCDEAIGALIAELCNDDDDDSYDEYDDSDENLFRR